MESPALNEEMAVLCQGCYLVSSWNWNGKTQKKCTSWYNCVFSNQIE
jgi:hypothetical protein